MKGHHQAAAVLVFGVYLFLSSCNGILVKDFIGFPFSSQKQLPPGDDKSLTVPISQPLLVNGNRHSNVHINTNGALTFTKPFSDYTPQPLPFHASSEMLAVFWTDLNSNVQLCNGTLESKILYEEYSVINKKSSNLIYRQIDSKIGHVSRCANISFETSWAFVVTWRQVAYYNTLLCDKYTDFQVILATDGKVTFALLNYANIDEKFQPALVGVNAGDGINFHLHPSSLTDNIYSIDDKQGNTGTRGQWVFRIDHINKNTDYSLGSHSGNIHLSPSVGSYFGGTPVLIDGPCILEFKNVTCTFGTQEVPGIRIKEAQYLCVTPDFDVHQAGPVPFSLTLSSHLYDTKIVSDSTFHRARQNPGPDKKVTIQSDTYPLIESPGTMTITWRPEFIPLPDPQSYTVDIAIYAVVISNATLRLLDTLATDVPNSGSAEISLGTYQTQTGLVKIRVTMSTNQRRRRKRQLGPPPILLIPPHVDVFAVIVSTTNDCSHWDSEEVGIQAETLMSQTIECPLTRALITSGPARVQFTASLPADGSGGTCFQEWKQEMVHPDADTCFEQSAGFATPTGPGNECCYNVAGNLCSEPNCAGTIDRFSPSLLLADGDHCFQHYEYDIFPALRDTPTDPPRCPTFRQQRPSDGRPFIVRAPPPRPRGNIRLSTSVGSYFGGTSVLIDGPSIAELNEVTCTFGTQEVPGIRVNGTQYLCVTPDFDEHQAGPVPFSLTLSSNLSDTKIVANSTFHRARQNPGPTNKVRILSETYPIIESPGTMNITWRPDFIQLPNPQSYTVDIAIYEVVISNVTLRLLDTLATNVPNSGSAEVTLGEYNTRAGLVEIQIMARTDQRRQRAVTRGGAPTSNRPICTRPTVRIDAILNSALRDRSGKCKKWEEGESGIDGQLLLRRTNPCPPTKKMITHGLCRSWFTNSIEKDANGVELRGTCFQEWKQKMIHPDASDCYETARWRINTTTEPGNECCYDKNGQLCVQENCGGSIDRITYTPKGGQDCLKHYEYDILPAIRKNKDDPHLCSSFRVQRPTQRLDRHFSLLDKERGGNAGGDPHIITLDGLHYTFNGKGEFTLVETPNDRLTIQGRMTEYRNDNTSQLSGTVFSAIAAKTHDSDTVQIEITPERKLITLVNGEMVNFDDVRRLPYNKVVVELKSETLISISFVQHGGTYIEVREESGVISDVAVFPSEDYKGITRGLLGNFNNDTTDDLVPKGNDTAIPSNSSVEGIHKTVGITWIVSNASESLLTYHDGEAFKDYYYPSYTPVFVPTFSDPGLEKRAKEMCNGDENCLFDVAATGSLTIGLAIKHANEFRNRERPPPPTCTPPCANDGICVENNACICQLGWTGQGCSEIDRPAPIVSHRCVFHGVLVWWSIPAYFDVSGHRLTVTEIIGGTALKQILQRERLSTSILLRIKRGVQYIARVEAKILGEYSPAGEEIICCDCNKHCFSV